MAAKSNPSMVRALTQAVSELTEEEAVALWNAISQWAENTRVYIEEQDEPNHPDLARTKLELSVVEILEDAGNNVMADLVIADLAKD